MSTPRPLQSFLGGVGLSLPVHALLLLNGSVFGISGFLHRAVRGSKEAIASAAGLLLGGMFVGLTERAGPQPFPLPFPHVILSGLLVGVGTKVIATLSRSFQNLNTYSRWPTAVPQGDTYSTHTTPCLLLICAFITISSHMISGIARFSVRSALWIWTSSLDDLKRCSSSITATAIFFSTGVIATRLLHGTSQVTGQFFDWSLDSSGKALLAFQAVPCILSAFLYIFVRLYLYLRYLPCSS